MRVDDLLVQDVADRVDALGRPIGAALASHAHFWFECRDIAPGDDALPVRRRDDERLHKGELIPRRDDEVFQFPDLAPVLIHYPPVLQSR
jgi:hypothetical protein